ncbi:transcription factor grauzone-like [Musca autumnalis]|uniref:transcription factor grauzone-like n=1 Tax=Musca autumnalis TaxID=221902 RepID=UPI003CF6CF9E
MICRLCLREIPIPKESVIKLFTEENKEVLNLIEKYLEIKILQNDVISTAICQDCHDHLFSFSQFCKDVSSKQSTLHSQYLGDVKLKTETECNEDLEADADNSYANDAIFEPCIDFVKSELNVEDNEIITGDVLNENELTKDDEADYDDEDHGDDDYMDMDNSMSEDDLPLINLRKSKKKTTKKSKGRKEKSGTTKGPRNLEKKTRRKKYLSAQQIIASCIELKCDICQVEVNTWKDLREHFLIAHTRSPYMKCCNTVFEKQRPLADHLLWHENSGKIKCKQCYEVLDDLKDLAKHILNEHPSKPSLTTAIEYHECPHCSRQFRNFKAYTTHVKKHNIEEKDGAKSVECLVCSNKKFETEQELRQHIDSEHNDTYYHICEICGKKFKCKESFKKHYATHDGIVQPPVQCAICHKFYKNYDSLRLHRMRHEERPKSCDICGRNFTTQRSWKKHVQYWHEMEKNLPCTLCDKVFREKRNLDEHTQQNLTEGVLCDDVISCHLLHWFKGSRERSDLFIRI